MIRIFPDLESLSRAAVELFVEKANKAVQDRNRFSVALSGGTTPQRMYELLAQSPFRDQVPWKQVHVFWGDERCVPVDDRRSNERQARAALLDRVPIPPSQIHPARCLQAPELSAQQYEAVLREHFANQLPRFDLILLGLGENGHTASLFPYASVLDEHKRWVAGVYVAEQDLHRITLTAPVINQAETVVFLVSGASKAQILEQVMRGSWDPHRLPAQLIHPANGEPLWLVDIEAARLNHTATVE